MNAKTLKALKGSIRKWKRIVAGTGEDLGVKNCPLCQVFLKWDGGFNFSCTRCPVAKAAKAEGCDNTPYMDYCEDGSKENTIRELNFLKSLLPKKITNRYER